METFKKIVGLFVPIFWLICQNMFLKVKLIHFLIWICVCIMTNIALWCSATLIRLCRLGFPLLFVFDCNQRCSVFVFQFMYLYFHILTCLCVCVFQNDNGEPLQIPVVALSRILDESLVSIKNSFLWSQPRSRIKIWGIYILRTFDFGFWRSYCRQTSTGWL